MTWLASMVSDGTLGQQRGFMPICAPEMSPGPISSASRISNRELPLKSESLVQFYVGSTTVPPESVSSHCMGCKSLIFPIMIFTPT